MKPLLWLRSAAYMAWLVLSVIPYAVAVVLLSPFVRGRTLYGFCLGWVRFALWGATLLCGIRTRVQGMEHLPDGPVILCPKHQSAWETLALPVLMPRPLSYVFKRELLFVPFFGWALGRLEMVHIDRKRGAEAFGRVAAQGGELLRKGYWIIMFPEGTRTARGREGAYKVGAARLALLTGTPLLPIAITSARCWPRQSFLKYPGTIEVSIGQPIAPDGRGANELMQDAQRWIEAEMRRLDPDAYAAAAD